MILLDETDVSTASKAKLLLQTMHFMMNNLLPDASIERNQVGGFFHIFIIACFLIRRHVF